jgi:outer membrane protein TolC
MSSRFLCAKVVLSALTLAPQLLGQTAHLPALALSEQDAVATAVAKNPSLHVALLRASQSRLDVTAEDALYTPIFGANAGYTRARTPSLSGTDDVRFGTNDIVDLGVGLSKPFATGTTVSANLAGQRSLRTSSITQLLDADGRPASADACAAADAMCRNSLLEVDSGPGYSLVGRLSVTQPLMRGFGSELGLSSLRQAKLNLAASELAAQQTASELLSRVVTAYWEVWYAHEVVHINEASRELAKVQEAQAQQQVASGALAPASALAYVTRVAELEEAVLSARTDARQRELSLAQLLGEPGGVASSLTAADVPHPPSADDPVEARAVDDALRTSYSQKQLQTQLALAKEQLKTAGDPLRPRLDVDAYVQAEGLGNRRVPPAFEQFGKMQGVSAHVGLTFETPITDTRRTAQIEATRLSAHIIEKQLVENEVAIRSSVASALTRMHAAREKAALSTRTEKVAREQAQAERARFQAGSSIAISVQEAEDSLRQAQLRAQRARVDLMLAELQLLELRGELLSRYAGALARLPAADRGTLERSAPRRF